MLNVVDLAVTTRVSALGEDRAQGSTVALVTTQLNHYASVAQRIAHRLSTPRVAGSNPVGGTEFDTDKLRKIHRLWESLVNPHGWGPGNRVFESRQPDRQFAPHCPVTRCTAVRSTRV